MHPEVLSTASVAGTPAAGSPHESLNMPGPSPGLFTPAPQVRPYRMDFIQDKNLYRAVMCARWLIRENRQRPFYACQIAARKYGVNREDVHHYVSQVAGRSTKGPRHTR